MFSLINSLQQRPLRQRRAVALWAAVGITVIIFCMWLLSFFSHLDALASAPATHEAPDTSPFRAISGMAASVSNAFSGVSDALSKLRQ
jgi:hypothetical protein